MSMLKAIVLSAGTAVAALPFQAPVIGGPVHIQSGGTLPSFTEAGYRQNLRKLQRDALAQTQRDGGTLTPAHRAKFQRRLERVKDLYERTLDNNNPLLVNADGSRVRSPGASRKTDWTYSPLVLVGTQR